MYTQTHKNTYLALGAIQQQQQQQQQ